MINPALTGIVSGGAGFIAGLVGGWFVKAWIQPGGAAPSLGDRRGSIELPSPVLQPIAPTSESSGQAPQFDRFMLSVVDVIDEIELMTANSTPEVCRSLDLVQSRLENNVELAGGELIREKAWQSALQRAVKVETAEPGQTDVRLLRCRAMGLKHRGRLIRKQDVVISQP